MTNYSLRARMMILILAPTVLIGLLLSIFFVAHRYNDRNASWRTLAPVLSNRWRSPANMA